MSPLWMSIDPGHDETRLMLTEARVGAALRARLPPVPRQPRALAQLLSALSAWYGMPLTAVIDAGAEGALHHPERWAQLLGEIDGEQVRVEWIVVPARAEAAIASSASWATSPPPSGCSRLRPRGSDDHRGDARRDAPARADRTRTRTASRSR